MEDITFLTPEQIISIQRETLPQGAFYDENKLYGALGRVDNHVSYERCEDIFELAAVYLISIAKAHAFADANKRTAFISCASFLRANGQILIESFFLVKLTVMVAEDRVTLKQTAFLLELLSDFYFRQAYNEASLLVDKEQIVLNLTMAVLIRDNIDDDDLIASANTLLYDGELDSMANQIAENYTNHG
ncbi:type II toxin-antitoxin system death-on-curing family toxin [Serratia fonticola]